MPNWCENHAVFNHPDSGMIQQVSEAFAQRRLMSHFVPGPTELYFQSDSTRLSADEMACNTSVYGSPDWHAWATENWGTKWDVGPLDTQQESSSQQESSYRPGDTEIHLHFDTAWAPPCEFYLRMEELGFAVTAQYCDVVGGFCGMFANGMDVSFEIPLDVDDAEDVIPGSLMQQFDIVGQMTNF